MVLLRIIPRLKESISDGVSGGLVCAKVIEIESCTRQCVLNVVHDLPLDGCPVSAKIGAHELPHLIRALLGGVILELRLKDNERYSENQVCRY